MDIRCEIQVRGHLSSEWTAVFEGMEITCLPDGDTALIGFLPDQAALYGLLLLLRDLGLTLVSVNPVLDKPRNSPIPSGQYPMIV